MRARKKRGVVCTVSVLERLLVVVGRLVVVDKKFGREKKKASARDTHLRVGEWFAGGRALSAVGVALAEGAGRGQARESFGRDSRRPPPPRGGPAGGTPTARLGGGSRSPKYAGAIIAAVRAPAPPEKRRVTTNVYYSSRATGDIVGKIFFSPK